MELRRCRGPGTARSARPARAEGDGSPDALGRAAGRRMAADRSRAGVLRPSARLARGALAEPGALLRDHRPDDAARAGGRRARASGGEARPRRGGIVGGGRRGCGAGTRRGRRRAERRAGRTGDTRPATEPGRRAAILRRVLRRGNSRDAGRVSAHRHQRLEYGARLASSRARETRTGYEHRALARPFGLAQHVARRARRCARPAACQLRDRSPGPDSAGRRARRLQ